VRLPGSAMRMRPLALGDACVRAGDWSGALTAYVRAVGEAARRGHPRDLAWAAGPPTDTPQKMSAGRFCWAQRP
jgi:hypothetical protein